MNKHGIPKTEETILFLNRLFIGMQDFLPAGQCGYQHKKGGLRQMEVGNQGIHHLKRKSRIDENICPAGLGFYFPLSLAADSRALQEVVPVQMTLPPLFLQASIFSATSWETE